MKKQVKFPNVEAPGNGFVTLCALICREYPLEKYLEKPSWGEKKDEKAHEW